ncbi:amphoterin-induced protein 1 [Emydura macquarii macquarii]|uniref:amphoterin-induced protein 1 n=1 Tax=Emydura macquarii macquarii TaxID=1129001 RepID=UPI00352AE638
MLPGRAAPSAAGAADPPSLSVTMWLWHVPAPRQRLELSCCGGAWFLLLLLLGCGLARGGGSVLNCPPKCVCASNIISCSKIALGAIPTKLPRFTAILDLSHNNLTRLRADWTPVRLAHLHSLLLNHNALGFISTEAFYHVPHLKYLDLSSNSIKALEEYLFSQLQELEVLLLYNNQIAQMDRSAFDDMARLQKLYLSQNLISRFPVELVKDKAKLPELALLDLSSNKIKGLPVAALKGLPAWIKNGLYLHSNPLSCDCGLYELFTHWHRRQLSSVVDFREELLCSLPQAKRSVSVFTLNSQDSLNCSEFKEHMLEAYLGDTVTINCDTKVRGATTREWVTPNNKRFPEEASNSTVTVLGNGSLQIRPVRVEDMGTYACYAVSQAFNETLYVDVMVHNFTQHGPHDTLNTAYTTLVGCILSVILVLIYLYLTPCRCWCRGNEKPAIQQEDSINSSMLSTTPNHDPELASCKESLTRHVVSSAMQGQNGKVKPNSSPERSARRAQKGHRKMSDPDSVSSVFSDTPIVV